MQFRGAAAIHNIFNSISSKCMLPQKRKCDIQFKLNSSILFTEEIR